MTPQTLFPARCCGSAPVPGSLGFNRLNCHRFDILPEPVAVSVQVWEACGTVCCALVFGAGGHRFKPHCSQLVVSLGKTLAPVGIAHSIEYVSRFG